jgi:hypothetical protein
VTNGACHRGGPPSSHSKASAAGAMADTTPFGKKHHSAITSVECLDIGRARAIVGLGPRVTLGPMPTPPTKRRHHVVPKFVLKKFADPPKPNGTLVAIDKMTGNLHKTTPARATVEPDYYVLPGDAQLDVYAKDVPEDDLGRIESAAAPIIAALCQRTVLPEAFEDRAKMALFMAMMRARPPREREQFSAASEHELNRVVRSLRPDREWIARFLESRGDGTSQTEIDSFAERLKAAQEHGEIKVKVPLDRSLGTLMHVAVVMSAEIYEVSWWVLRAAANSQFVMSDCPVAMYDIALRDGCGNAFKSSPLAETTLPLSPDTCLLLRPSGIRLGEREAPADEVSTINLRTYAWSRRWIFGPSEQAVREVRERADADSVTLAAVTPRPYFHLTVNS